MTVLQFLWSNDRYIQYPLQNSQTSYSMILKTPAWKTPASSLLFSLCWALLIAPISVHAQSPLAYDSPTLKVKKLTEHTYQHVSYLQTETWGKVGCNGMIYAHKVRMQGSVRTLDPDCMGLWRFIEIH